ncbi:hypothetical protein L2E82_48571 [Cichorium intybus]|uniref:Uncharacterized protein n=1 Tax=Cichorium intybus TaxID=13427 RepID=A0ACB8YXL5_CICIN|nr:hypothetical protein L2E82_48571 [Cichorium intybus]
MDTSNWRPMVCGDWRTNILKRFTAFGQEVEYLLEKTSVGYEEFIYSTATSQVDYLQQISMKMQKLETSHNPLPVASSANRSNLDSNNPKSGPQLLPHIMLNYMGSTGIQVGDSSIESGDWRNQLQAGSRQSNVNGIRMNILKRHLPFSEHEMLQELEKIVAKFEDTIYIAATSQFHYRRNISFAMLTMEIKSKNLLPDDMQSKSGANGVHLSDSAIGESSMEPSNWRDQLQADSRKWIVNKIMDTLKKHVPLSGSEMLNEIEKVALRFEEKIYTSAISQSDYMQKIFLKMPTMEMKSQDPGISG